MSTNAIHLVFGSFTGATVVTELAGTEAAGKAKPKAAELDVTG